MNLIFLLLIIVGVLIILLFTVGSRVKFILDSANSNMNLTLLWLPPLLKASVATENTGPVLTIYLFNKKVYSTVLKGGKRKTGGMQLVNLAKPKDVQVNASYGFKDPFITGTACGVINIASQFINIDSINQEPDFLASNDYVYLDASAKVNLGTALVKIFRNQGNNRE